MKRWIESLTDKEWIFYGVIALLGFGMGMFTHGVMTVLFPMPVYMVLMGWTIGLGTFAVMPALYALATFAGVRSENFARNILIFAAILAALSIWYFVANWHYGVTYQGQDHTVIVAIENGIGFAIVLFLAALGYLKEQRVMTLSANLLLFILLAWCAFPYLGEMP